jgi:hypothetical protein
LELLKVLEVFGDVELDGVGGGAGGYEGGVCGMNVLKVMKKESVEVVFGDDDWRRGHGLGFCDVAGNRGSEVVGECTLLEWRYVVGAHPVPNGVVGGNEDGKAVDGFFVSVFYVSG